MCTGFQSLLPFFEASPKLDGRALYKNVFLPGEPKLAFIGFIRPNIGSVPAVAEMQARWFASVLAGRVKLPDAEKMQQVIASDAQRYNQTRPHQAQRLTSLADYHAYMEELAGFVGCRPQLWRVLGQPRLLYTLLFGPMACFQYRLHGHGANPEAVMKAVAQLPGLPKERVMLHLIVYLMKPWFALLVKIGGPRFRPVI